MLGFLLLGIAGYVLLCSIVQICVALRLAIALRTPVVASPEFGLPKAAIILAIRGLDPSLERNIRALISQDYPDYRVFVVVDHVEDPAWRIVGRIHANHPDRIQVSTLRDRLVTCSLKCSAMAQSISELDPSYEVVAFADGDVLAHKTWLRGLVEPLADPRVGASTGSRWYLPTDSGLGSMTRYFWNAAGVMQIWLNGFVWPGSMAFRSEALNKMDLASGLRNSLFDGPVAVRELRRAGYKTSLAPSVVVANREQISLGDFTSWVERQTLVASSLGTNWLLLGFTSAHLMICAFLPALLAGLAFANSETTILHWALLATAFYWFAMALSVFILECAIRSVSTLDQGEIRWFSLPKALSAGPGLVLAHLVPLLAALRAINRKTISWRGIEYEIRGPDEVHMVNYTPYRGANNPRQSVL
jgi:cellulose synthase/poly-beta-1,6-N-acetylglucosamine synthase-like glycosyltransferase